MRIFTSEGIVINKLKYLESDLILTIFVKGEGKIKAIVKGGVNSRKRFPGAFEIGNTGEFGLVDKNHYQLMHINHARIDNYLINLKKDYGKIVLLFYLAGITEAMLIEHHSHPRLYDTLLSTLQFLDSDIGTVLEPGTQSSGNSRFLDQVRLFYELHLLRESGILPALDKCEACGTLFADEQVYCAVKTGKFVCYHCTPHIADTVFLPADIVHVMQAVVAQETDIRTFLGTTVPHSIFNVTTRLMENYLERPLKIWRMIDTLQT